MACDTEGETSWLAEPPAVAEWNALPATTPCTWDELPALLAWKGVEEDFANATDPMNSRDLEDHVDYLPTTLYTRGMQIGGGGFGRVFKVQRESDGHVLAGKTCRDTIKLVEEAMALRKHAHPHILKYEGTYENAAFPGDNMLLTELCADGSLQGLIDDRPNGLGAQTVLRVVMQIASALEHLHSRGYFHSDVKPQNIFVRSRDPPMGMRMDVVLGDCADIHPQGYSGQLLGTMQFHSPEVWRSGRHQGATDDIWALGISLLSMCGQLPTVECRPKDVKEQLPGRGRHRRRHGANTPAALLRRFPAQVLKHLGKLRRLNPNHGIVELAARMLTPEVHSRARAGEVYVAAEALLEIYEANKEQGSDLDIKSPDGFRPVQFW